MPKDWEDIHLGVLGLALNFLTMEKLTSVKLVATRCLIKYARKIKPDVLYASIQTHFEVILDELTGLLDSTSMDTIYLPIEAFTQYSRLNEEIVAKMAPKVTPKLLRLFRQYH